MYRAGPLLVVVLFAVRCGPASLSAAAPAPSADPAPCARDYPGKGAEYATAVWSGQLEVVTVTDKELFTAKTPEGAVTPFAHDTLALHLYNPRIKYDLVTLGIRPGDRVNLVLYGLSDNCSYQVLTVERT